MKIIKLFLMMAVLFGVVYTQAYTWTVKNNTDKKIHVKINLACASKGPEADISPKQSAGLKAEDVKLGINWAAGCCLSSIEVTPEGSPTQKYSSKNIWDASIDPANKASLAEIGVFTLGTVPAFVATKAFCSDNMLGIYSDKILTRIF